MKSNTLKLSLVALVAFFMVGLSSCDKEPETKPDTKPLEIPTTYNFENVSYSGQTTRIKMLGEITKYMKSATSGAPIDAAKLKKMFANEGNQFTDPALNSDSKKIKNKVFAGDISKFEGYMDALANISGVTTEAAPGTVGVATAGTKKYFLDAKGVEYAQLVDKGLMGALMYYQIVEVYTSEDKIGDAVDNTTVEAGKGTKMEHHWDEAFGYTGANNELKSDDYSYHAKYSGKGEAAGLKTRTNLFNAFLAGRAAISAKDMARKKEEAENVKKYMEEVTVTTAIHYLNGGKKNFTNYAKRCHELSEGYAFIFSLKYNSNKKISNADLALVEGYFKDSSGELDFANISIPKINDAINKLSSIYGLDAVKATL